MATQKATEHPMRRPDETILEDIWQGLWKEETIRAIDIHDICIDVEYGQVCLSGHVTRDYHKQRITEIARSIFGVSGVHNHLVTDCDLIFQVAGALAGDERTRSFILPVYSDHGWVALGGQVPDCDTQLAAEETAARISVVRGVIQLPRIEGEPCPPFRKAVQPAIGVSVYGKGEIKGMVYQVIINPKNRLVTHAIVRVTPDFDERHASCDFLISVDALNVVDEGGIFLNQNERPIHQFPIFNPAHYPFAPLTWQPPYPYAAGNVRWPRLEQTKSMQNREGKTLIAV